MVGIDVRYSELRNAKDGDCPTYSTHSASFVIGTYSRAFAGVNLEWSNSLEGEKSRTILLV